MFRKILGTLMALVFISVPAVAAEREPNDAIGRIGKAITPHLEHPECKRLMTNLLKNAHDINVMLSTYGPTTSHPEATPVGSIAWAISRAADSDKIQLWGPRYTSERAAKECAFLNNQVYVYANKELASIPNSPEALRVFNEQFPNFHWEK